MRIRMTFDVPLDAREGIAYAFGQEKPATYSDVEAAIGLAVQGYMDTVVSDLDREREEIAFAIADNQKGGKQ